MLYWTDSLTEMDFANQRPSQFVLARSPYIVKSQRNYSYLEAVTVCCGQKPLHYELKKLLLLPPTMVISCAILCIVNCAFILWYKGIILLY